MGGVCRFLAGMAGRHGVGVQANLQISVETVLLAVGGLVGHAVGGYLPLRRVSVSGGPPFMPGEGLERGPQGFRKPVSELMFWGAKVRT